MARLPVSYVLTYRGGADPARAGNLAAVLDWLQTQDLAQVIVVEQDRAPTLPERIGPAVVVHAFHDGPFNKGWGLNVGARRSTQPLLAFGDADTVCHGLRQAVGVAAAGVPVVRPFTGIVDLDEATSAAIRARPAEIAGLAAGTRAADRLAQGEHSPLCGGVFLIHRAHFVLLGGWDERFLGWGGDDDAMTIKIRRAAMRTHVMPSTDGFHLHHARATPAAPGDPLYRGNLDLLEQLRTLSEPELKRLCEVQWFLAGDANRHRREAA
jgi:hypothetical protein